MKFKEALFTRESLKWQSAWRKTCNDDIRIQNVIEVLQDIKQTWQQC